MWPVCLLEGIAADIFGILVFFNVLGVGHPASLEPFCLAEQCLVKCFDADSSGVAGLSPL